LSSGGSGLGGAHVRANELEEAPQEGLRIVFFRLPVEVERRHERIHVAVAEGDPNAGGSMTASERTASGRRAAASSETTPPYEWPTKCAPSSSAAATSGASSSKSSRSTIGVGP
jgi:hypothetical protein